MSTAISKKTSHNNLKRNAALSEKPIAKSATRMPLKRAQSKTAQPQPQEASEPRKRRPLVEAQDAGAKKRKVAAPKARESSPVASVSGPGAASEESNDSDPEADTHLHGFGDSSEEDSSDSSGDEGEGEERSTIDVSKLPTVAKDDASVKRKLEKAKKEPSSERGVLYLGRIPHGFYEDQMRGYFTQFGEVTRLRISRNKRTGRSKHYGFLEFASLPVAEIVAETMDNYLLMGSLLQCKVIPKDEVHPELWVGANRKWRKVPHARVERQRYNKERSEEQKAKAEARLLKRQREKQDRISAAGIHYDVRPAGYNGS